MKKFVQTGHGRSSHPVQRTLENNLGGIGQGSGEGPQACNDQMRLLKTTILSSTWWLPTTNFDSDPPTMSALLDAQSRVRNTPHAISDKMIRHANLVRLFLRATFLSEILNTEMTAFADWAVEATRQRQTSETYPTQAPPSPQMLQQWKTILR